MSDSVRIVEVGEFVSPEAIPQMVNSDAVLRGASALKAKGRST